MTWTPTPAYRAETDGAKLSVTYTGGAWIATVRRGLDVRSHRFDDESDHRAVLARVEAWAAPLIVTPTDGAAA